MTAPKCRHEWRRVVVSAVEHLAVPLTADKLSEHKGWLSVDKPTVPEVLPLVNAHYKKPGNEVGGIFHVMLDDGNNAQYFADSALGTALQRLLGKVTPDRCEFDLAWKLAAMSPTQRKKLYRMHR